MIILASVLKKVVCGGVEDVGHHVLKQGDWWESFYNNLGKSMVKQLMMGKIKDVKNSQMMNIFLSWICFKERFNRICQTNL